MHSVRAAGPHSQGFPPMPQLDERAIFDAARQIEAPEARLAYLKQACAGDRRLLARIEQLLRIHDEDETFLRSPAVPLPLFAAEDTPGAQIGPYKLVEQIGEGGFGMVYVAEQLRPVRRLVALKIVKPGMDTRQVIARFEAERQALAMMEHPNIARVFDGGATPAGRPFFVMELVKGVPITRYCDERQLSPHDRLQLFVAVCKAVQHAHQKGIIHRDLKPTNVLVAAYDGQPVPKIIDFGVAKALAQQLTERTLVTSFGGIIGTLEYMSPEQAEFNARDIDTRADVYSLGVILYELLTGVTPLAHERLKRTAIGEALRLIREEDPPKPSTRLSEARDSLASISAQRKLEPAALTQALRGELDWIAMKALDKDRDRRYQTANGLARDIERFLNDEPVEACPPSPAYRLRKFARKNRGLLSAIGAFALLLSVATAVSGLLAYRAILAERAMGEERDRAELQAASARGHEYVAHMNLAQAAWESNRLEHLATLLRDHVPDAGEKDLRGFEWYYWHRLIDTPRVTFQGHQGDVAGVAISRSGRLAASASHDGTARIWELETGREFHTLRGHNDIVWSVAFSPDEKYIATASFDGTVKIWDVATGNERATLRGHSTWAVSVAFSPDGRRLASASHDRTVRLWDATTGTELRTIAAHSDIVMCVAFSPDGRRLASSSKDRTIKLWDVASGQELSKLEGHTDEVACVAFSPDGNRLASASLDYTAKVWDTATGVCLKTITAHTERVFCVAFDPLGGRLATTGWDRTIRFWDACTFQSLGILKGHGQSIAGIAFSSDGRRLVSGSLDRTAKVWNSVAGQETSYEMHEPASPKPMYGIAFSPDGSRLASGGQSHCVEVWDANSSLKQMTLRGHSGEVVSIAFSPDGTRLASGARDNTARIWDASTGRALHTLRPVTAHFPRVAFSPDGSLLATPGAENTVALWDVATGELRRSLATDAQVHCVAFSPNGKWLTAGTRASNVIVWDRSTHLVAHTLRGHQIGNTGVVGVTFSPDSRWLASAGVDHCVKLWEVDTGRSLATLRGHIDWVSGVSFSPDGRRLASSSADKTIKLWDLATGEETLSLKAHTHLVLGVAFSPGGRRLASAGYDGTVRLWDARPWTPGLRAQSAARRWVIRCLPESGLKLDLVGRLEGNAGLPGEVRREALLMAAQYREDAEALNLKSWQVVARADAAPEGCELALRQAEAADRLAPEKVHIINTLGVALYRCGKFNESLEVLGRCDALRAARPEGRHPCDLMFLAMANFRLGRADEARACLAEARHLLQQPPRPTHEEDHVFLREATQLIEGGE